jgi:hypothetical protein
VVDPKINNHAIPRFFAKIRIAAHTQRALTFSSETVKIGPGDIQGVPPMEKKFAAIGAGNLEANR